MPSYLEREQRKQDSLRAAIWAERTGDSSFLKNFLQQARIEAQSLQKQEYEKRREEKRKQDNKNKKDTQKQNAILNPEINNKPQPKILRNR